MFKIPPTQFILSLTIEPYNKLARVFDIILPYNHVSSSIKTDLNIFFN